MSSDITIGPLYFPSHTVQSIDIYEIKNVEQIQPTRTESGVIIPSGTAQSAATITFLFSEEELRYLRKLFILFRVSPVISAKNEMLSDSWRRDKSKTKFVPITLNELSISSVPDIPYTYYCYLSIRLIDPTPISGGVDLKYIGNNRDHSLLNPTLCYPLKNWINKLDSTQKISNLPEGTSFKFYGLNALGISLDDKLVNSRDEKIPELFFNYSNPLMISESCKLQNYFVYNTLIGKSLPFAQHMGTSAKSYSAEVIYDTSTGGGKAAYEDFIKFKDISDKLIRSAIRPDRVAGWKVDSPIIRLLNIKVDKNKKLPFSDNIFAPIQVSTKNGEAPNSKQVQFSLIQNNVNYYYDSEFILTQGGTESKELKKYFLKIAAKEQLFREVIKNSTLEKATGLTSLQESYVDFLSAFRVFWPTSRYKTSSRILETSNFGLLNRDTLRATLLSYELDSDGQLKKLLKNHLLVNQKVDAADINPDNPEAANLRRQLDAITRAKINSYFVSKSLFGFSIEEDPLAKEILYRIYDLLSESFIENTSIGQSTQRDPTVLDRYNYGDQFREKLIELAGKLTASYLGDRSQGLFGNSDVGEVISDLAASDIQFSSKFLDALYDTIISRKAPSSEVPRVYDVEGLEAAFFKLIVDYKSSPDYYNTPLNEELTNQEPKQYNKNYCYSDLILPSYFTLFGEAWREFAPTFSDYGIINYSEIKEEYNPDINLEPAVNQDDIVDPGIWYYHKRYKTGEKGIENLSKKVLEEQYDTFKGLSVSIPFDIDQIEILDDKLTKNERTKEDQDEINKIIEQSLRRAKAEKSEAEFNTDMRNLALSSVSKFSEKYLGKDSKGITLYTHHNNNYGAQRKITTPGLGGEIFRVASELEYIKPFMEEAPQAENYKSSYLSNEFNFIRNSLEGTEQTIMSSIAQMPEDQRNPNTLYPACKVYLLEYRGDDLYADDLFFNINSIVSVDITLDQDDAGLAVIKIADPLYNLQNGNFRSNNIEYRDYEKYVLSNMRGGDLGGYLKKHKVIQGRPVQIRMGYSSNPDNLDIVFTGKITEIVPGDMLTIVCQDWKAELISRQVSFYNDDGNNYGARDLAIQAITYADPQGFGTVYSQRDLDYILEKNKNLDADTVIRNSERNRSDITLEQVGSRSISENIQNYFRTTVGLASMAKRNLGLDTRLKNIWYPDLGRTNNVFGWRSFTGWHPLWANDSWIVPIQSSWDVLKESARHAWNCIVQVVPFDGMATIFMGHPDQPYVYTNANSKQKAAWSKFRKSGDQDNLISLNNLYDQFRASKYYSKEEQVTTVDLDISTFINRRASATSYLEKYAYTTILKLLAGKGINPYVSAGVAQSDISARTLTPEEVTKNIQNSILPLEVYKRMKREVFGEITPNIILNLYTGIPLREISLIHPALLKDIEKLLSPNFDPNLIGQVSTYNGEFFDNPLEMYEKELTRLKSRIQNLFRISTEGFRRYNPPLSGSNDGSASVRELINHCREFQLILQNLKPVVKDSSQEFNFRNSISNQTQITSTFANRIDVLLRSLDNTLSLIESKNYLVKIEEFENTTKELVENFVDDFIEFYPSLNKNESNSLNSIFENSVGLKAFIYYFGSFILEDETINPQDIKTLASKGNYLLPPTMKAFRVHHYIDSDTHIIQNNIVASTKEMWNTVLIEHPAKGSANDVVSSLDEVYTSNRLNSGVEWNYYPKSDVTQVKGLQFHPGLTLANKKLKVCTEINAYSPPLLAKLACHHLADGIKRMYRGTLLVRGKNIKPYDRIILNDKYTNMKGPIDVESVVHHWSADNGWVTNLIPQAVCEANPGAAILEAAVTERVYNLVFDAIDFTADVFTVVSILSGIGSVAGAAAGQGAKAALVSLVKQAILNKKGVFSRIKDVGITLGKGSAATASNIFVKSGGGPIAIVGATLKQFGPAINTALTGYTATELAELLAYGAFNIQVTSAFAEAANTVEQLPVKFRPLIHTGIPFIAGLETDEAVFTVLGSSIFNSIHDYQLQAQKWLENISEEVR